MRVKAQSIRPIQKEDGSWTTVIEEYYEDIPDLGRMHLICNKCGWSTYPECVKTCDILSKEHREEILGTSFT